MYTIKETDYGFRLCFQSDCSVDEIKKLEQEIKSIASTRNKPFSAFIDARKIIPFKEEVVAAMQRCEEIALEGGCIRFAVVTLSPVAKDQIKRVAFKTGIADCERYINANRVTNWEEVGLNWAIHGTEPDQCSASQYQSKQQDLA